jgi:hypothetical protein
VKKTDVKEALSLITDMLAKIHVKLQDLDNRLLDLEALTDTEGGELCECGHDHSKELADLIGQVVHIELKDDKAGPWFFVMTTANSSLMVQELTKPDGIREKIGDPKWYALNEINKITVEKTL